MLVESYDIMEENEEIDEEAAESFEVYYDEELIEDEIDKLLEDDY